MRKKYEQMSLLDTYKSVEERVENNKPELFQLLDEHLDWEEIIPARFYSAFYRHLGRKRGYELESFLGAVWQNNLCKHCSTRKLKRIKKFINPLNHKNFQWNSRMHSIKCECGYSIGEH